MKRRYGTSIQKTYRASKIYKDKTAPVNRADYRRGASHFGFSSTSYDRMDP